MPASARCRADILAKENRQGVGAGRGVGARRSGEEVFGHGWCVGFLWMVVFVSV